MTDTEAEDCVRVREGAAVWRRVDDETIILCIDEGVYLRLNPTASELWTLIVAGATADEMATHLVDTFDVDHSTAEHDIAVFIAQCCSRRLLVQ